MLAVRVPRKEAEKTRRKLMELGVLARGYAVKREAGFVLFPVTEPVEGFQLIETDFKRVEPRPHSYREVVEVPESLRRLLPGSFDVIGDVAIVEIPEELKGYGRAIGEAILRVHRHIKVVLAKGGNVSGEYRVRKLLHLAGERRTETLHRENGIRLKLDVTRVYFSPRLATERMRIFRKSRPGEVVFDMFAGVGPYSILLAKKVKLVFACDLNPWAVRYLEENVRLNRLNNVVPVLGDVRKVAGKVVADRVIMNLPKFAGRFLREAMLSVRDGGVVHYYGFGPEEDLFSEHEERIRATAEELGFGVEVLERRKVRPYAPRQFNVAIDFRVWK
ncbi:tRNA (guanine-N1)-methyltransferase [Thermococcus sp. P6]|uniref:tRNA (guanine(37)-N1)-methyltransferase Trm5b n=1 Tax=Thermococcus sp. P6 TaxID=122420 RepID=UPI000B59F6BE|nr:class I SAM-dependent methyltransferase family protein [Thermococcus sp. P6]ASJ10693.1 tRNA (guanine-N1)-methyltransferase [Thermococcus sp. P6]